MSPSAATFDVYLNKNLVQITLDDGFGQILRESNIAVIDGGFRGPIADDSGSINGVIEGQISGELGASLAGIYSYIDQNGGRAAGAFEGRR